MRRAAAVSQETESSTRTFDAWIVFCACRFFKQTKCLKIYQAEMLPTGAVTSRTALKSVCAGRTCAMCTQQEIIRCCNWMKIPIYMYMYSADIRRSRKSLVDCSRNIKATHLSNYVRCNSKHVFFLASSQVHSTQVLTVMCIWMIMLQQETSGSTEAVMYKFY